MPTFALEYNQKLRRSRCRLGTRLEDVGRGGEGGRLSRVSVVSGRLDIQQQTTHQHADHPRGRESAVRRGYRRYN